MTAPAVTNARIAALLREYADLLELRGESPFRTAAYRRGAEAIARLEQPVLALTAEELQQVEGIGKGLSAVAVEIGQRGTFAPLEELRAIIPSSVIRFTEIPGIGVKTAARLYKALGVATLDELRAAAEAGRIRAAKELGARVERTVVEGLAELAARDDRHPLGRALPLGLLLARLLAAAAPGTATIALAGSVRRHVDAVNDINLLAAATDPTPLLDTFATLPPVLDTRERAASTLTVTLDGELPVRLVVVPPARFGGELVRWTGSTAHLAALRDLARERGVTDPFAAGFADEAGFYAALGLPVIPPELREGRGEVAAAHAGTLPNLIETGDLRGDLHAHSTWSDGGSTIEEMARAAIARGYAYLSVSDHTHSLGVANGLDEARIRTQWREIDRLNAELAPFRLLKSAEVEIRTDGTLDLPDAVLAELDVVVASLHTGLRGDRATVTNRLLRAINNPHVDIIAHASGRIVGGRAGADYDWAAVFAAAAATHTAMEINASSERLDLNDEHARRALDAGILLTIDSDAHAAGGLDGITYGIAIARRAWVTARDVLNTRPLDDLLAWARER
jgi:DNA polymerase (family X)